MLIKIQPVTISPSYQTPAVTADYAQVQSADITMTPPGASGSVMLGTVDGSGAFIVKSAGSTVAMTAAQYAAWGTDDTYAAKCFVANMGLVAA